MFSVVRTLAGLMIAVGLLVLFPVWFPSPPTSSPSDPPGSSRAGYRPLSGWTDGRLRRQLDETDMDFVTRLTATVHRATYHCDAKQVNQTWAASIAAKRAPETSTYGYLDPSVLRCGLCHQRAFILSEALRRGGMAGARAFGLNGHVITLVEVEGRNYISDPDYGVGPILYNGNTYTQIPDTHYAAVVSPAVVESLRGAYAVTTDDADYVSHDWLITLALRQGDEVRAVERRLDIIGWSVFVGGLLLLFGALVLQGRFRWR
jgi:hypothetical protein